MVDAGVELPTVVGLYTDTRKITYKVLSLHYAISVCLLWRRCIYIAYVILRGCTEQRL